MFEKYPISQLAHEIDCFCPENLPGSHGKQLVDERFEEKVPGIHWIGASAP